MSGANGTNGTHPPAAGSYPGRSGHKYDANDHASRVGPEQFKKDTVRIKAESLKHGPVAIIPGECKIRPDEWHIAKLLDNPNLLERKDFIRSGYKTLDRALGGGFGLGECSTLFAPAGLGKTSFMANVTRNISTRHVPTLVISLEMPADEIVRLILAIAGNVERLHMRSREFTPDEDASMSEAFEQLSKVPLYIIDRQTFPANGNLGAPSMESVGAAIRDFSRYYGVRFVCLDYLAKVGPFDDSDLVRLPRLCHWTFDLAQRLGVHIMALAQTNKSAWGRRDEKNDSRDVGLQDLKGPIESAADFDNCIGLVRDDWNSAEPVDPAVLRAAVLKARHGPGGTAVLEFHRSTGRIVEVELTDAEPSSASGSRHSEFDVAAFVSRCMATDGKPEQEATILLRATDSRDLKITKTRAKDLLTAAIDSGAVFSEKHKGRVYYSTCRQSLTDLLFNSQGTKGSQS